MINFRLCILFILLSGSLKAQNSLSDILFWSDDVKLKLSDFKGLPDTTLNSIYNDKVAASSVEIIVDGDWEEDIPIFKVYTIFRRSESWYRDSVFYDNVLNHEQTHFDITEFFARKIRLEVARLRNSNCKELEAYTSIIQQLLLERNEFDSLYDLKTNHGINYQEQNLWEEKVIKELNILSEYSQ